jgi:hypothetical protein
MLEIWPMLLCDHVILDNNNKTVPLPPAVPTASATVQYYTIRNNYNINSMGVE